MKALRTPLKLRIALLALSLVLTGVALFSSSVTTAFAVPCYCGHALSVKYYSDASHTTLVGLCYFPCDDDPSCSGTQTEFSVTKELQCCIC